MRRLPLIVLLLMALLGAAWWVVLISPRDAEIRSLEADLEAARQQEALLSMRVDELERVRDREAEYLAALAVLETLLPDLPELDDLIEEIHGLSLGTGIDLVSMDPALPTPSPVEADLRQIGFNLRIEGEFFQLLGFLFGINDLDRLVRVDSIAINSETGDFQQTRLVVALRLRAFTLADLLPEVLEPLPEIDDLFNGDDGEIPPGEAEGAQDASGGDA